jgi:hypothetical protein
MASGDRATDWQACMIFNVGAGAGIAAGDYVFDFYSATVGAAGRFKFYGVGIGVGGNLSGGNLPVTFGPIGPWSSINCDRPFSIWDLNGSWGRLGAGSVGAGVTLGPMYITAAKPFFHSWFHSQNVGGFGLGAGAGLDELIGRWRYVSVSGNVPPAFSSGGTVA